MKHLFIIFLILTSCKSTPINKGEQSLSQWASPRIPDSIYNYQDIKEIPSERYAPVPPKNLSWAIEKLEYKKIFKISILDVKLMGLANDNIPDSLSPYIVRGIKSNELGNFNLYMIKNHLIVDYEALGAWKSEFKPLVVFLPREPESVTVIQTGPW